MRSLEQTGRFRRDYKRESRGRHGPRLDAALADVLDHLLQDRPLPPRFHDHALSGSWADHRDCHVRPDLVLIYTLPNETALRLVRLGSHSELGF